LKAEALILIHLADSIRDLMQPATHVLSRRFPSAGGFALRLLGGDCFQGFRAEQPFAAIGALFDFDPMSDIGLPAPLAFDIAFDDANAL
jgi:hypothetical protein